MVGFIFRFVYFLAISGRSRTQRKLNPRKKFPIYGICLIRKALIRAKWWWKLYCIEFVFQQNFVLYKLFKNFSLCLQIIAQGGSIFTSIIVVIILVAVLLSLKMSGSRIVQIKICRNKTIFFAFVTLIAIYFMCYTSLWMQVQEFKGSFEKRIKSYGHDKISWGYRVTRSIMCVL